MNMQYARAVLAHEQAYRDRALNNHPIVNVNVAPRPEVGPVVGRAVGSM